MVWDERCPVPAIDGIDPEMIVHDEAVGVAEFGGEVGPRCGRVLVGVSEIRLNLCGE